LLKPEIQLLIVLGKQLSAITPAYPCLDQHLNFIAACAEFLPLQSNSFDWVHMRSMLDHVQSPDLALMEAHRG